MMVAYQWKLKFDLWEGHILNIQLLFPTINFYTWVKIRGNLDFYIYWYKASISYKENSE